MKYGNFENMILPFINVRGGDIVYPYQSLSVAIENGIQDIYNEYKWSWLLTTRKIEKSDWIDGNGYYLIDMGNIKSINSLETFEGESNFKTEYQEVKRVTDLGPCKFLLHGNHVIVSEPISCSISYYPDYTWSLFDEDKTKEIPMPDKMIPALYYLVLSQIDIIEVTQSINQTYSNYGKYENKIRTLKENDLPVATSIAGGNRF